MDTLGDYTLHQLIGEGATGSVHRAQDRRSGRWVALKVLHPELARTPEARQQIVAELQPLLALSHPGLVRCLECREIDGRIVLGYELVEGLTLRAQLERSGRMAWPDALRVGTQLAEALASAHELAPPVVHRDLRPENVMVTTSNVVKVMDCGIAKVLGAAGQTTTATFGNISYMSPEQIDAFGIDPRSDVYCLGLVLYELITGSVPFKGSPRDLLNAQCTQPPPPFPAALQASVPADLEAVIRWMLAKSPDARPSSAREVSRLLHAVQAGQPVSVPAAGAASVAPALGRPSTPSTPPSASLGSPGAPVRSSASVVPSSARRSSAGTIVALVSAVVLLGGGAMAGVVLLGGDDEPNVATAPASGSLDPSTSNLPTASNPDGVVTPQTPVPEDPSGPAEATTLAPSDDDGAADDGAADDGAAADGAGDDGAADDAADDDGAADDGTGDDGGDDADALSSGLEALFGSGGAGGAEDPAVAMLLGSHSCGIHWLQRRGTCELSREGSTLRIKGSQKSSGDFLEIDGTVVVKDDRTFVVKGTLNSRVSGCCGTRNMTGSFKFKRHGRRKFWRLQDAGRICDPFKVCLYYIDIFMKKGEK